MNTTTTPITYKEADEKMKSLLPARQHIVDQLLVIDNQLIGINKRLEVTMPRAQYEKLVAERSHLVGRKRSLAAELREMRPEIRKYGDVMHEQWQDMLGAKIRALREKYTQALAGNPPHRTIISGWIEDLDSLLEEPPPRIRV